MYQLYQKWVYDKVQPWASMIKVMGAHIIGKAVWDQRGNIRDVISIRKLVHNNDGPAEVESILNTMVKYEEIHTHTR